MANVKVTLNRREVGLLLRTAFGDDVDALARRVAAHAGRDARLRRFVTDRQGVAISVPAHRQAKHGALSRAAAAAGLTVRGQI